MCPTLNLLLLAEEMVEMTKRRKEEGSNPAWLLFWQSSIVGEDAIDCFLWFLALTARYVCSPTLQTYPRTLISLSSKALMAAVCADHAIAPMVCVQHQLFELHVECHIICDT